MPNITLHVENYGKSQSDYVKLSVRPDPIKKFLCERKQTYT